MPAVRCSLCDRLVPAALLRRKWRCFVALLLGFFAINIVVITYYIDLRTQFINMEFQRNVVEEAILIRSTTKSVDDVSEKTDYAVLEQPIIEEQQTKCKRSRDPLSVSAYERMRTTECRTHMTNLLCAINNGVRWPMDEVENTCTSMFAKSDVYEYSGCILDNPSSRLLRGFKYQLKKDNPPATCVQMCLRAGYPLAGIQPNANCFCGNSPVASFEGRRVDDTKCRCNGHSSVNFTDQPMAWCGGPMTVALYRTGVIEMEKPLSLYQAPPDLDSTDDEGRWTPPKILFLLQLNGRNLRQIRRLLKLIYRPYHLYYVHIDARQPFMQREMLDVQRTLNGRGLWNFWIAGKDARYATIWGGTSLLDMFLGVVNRTFYDSNLSGNWSSWDYVMNLSETDMPLLSMTELEYHLFSNMGMSFLRSHGYNTASFIQKQGFNYLFMECEHRMWRIGTRSNFPHNLRLDGGSDWVVIYRDLAAFAVDKTNRLAGQLRALFSTILLPLESFFHTLALNSEFCTRILYQNLRLTNWRRKQGCRCAWLRRVVDWCGCSPLAIRHTERRFDIQKILYVQKCQSRLYFFARKFDSIIDVEAIAQAERQVLRFHSKRMRNALELSESFNSTWLNIYRADIDGKEIGGGVNKSALYNEWLRAMVINSRYISPEISYQSTNLNELFTYRADALAPLRIVASAHWNYTGDQQPANLEFLIERKRRRRITADAFVLANEPTRTQRRWEFRLDDIDVGLALDLKEDVLRDPTSLIQMNDTVQFLWFWRAREVRSTESHFRSANVSLLPANMTTPSVVVEIWASVGDATTELIQRTDVAAYDSINFAQNFELDLAAVYCERPDATPSIWAAKIISEHGALLVEILFPVYPSVIDTNGSSVVQRLTNHFYEVADVCFLQPRGNNAFETVTAQLASQFKHCHETEWSTQFPDPKSEIAHGYDKALMILT